MKDQRDLESIEVYLTHKARCHLSSKDSPKSSGKARHHRVTATALWLPPEPPQDKDTGRKTAGVRGREGVKPNKRKRFTF